MKKRMVSIGLIGVVLALILGKDLIGALLIGVVSAMVGLGLWQIPWYRRKMGG